MRLALDHQRHRAEHLARSFAGVLGDDLVAALLGAVQRTDGEIAAQRERVRLLRERLEGHPDPEAQELTQGADALVRHSVWIVGGDGWAYDIGFGGLDHVLASGRDVNLLVLDTEVYSNTGGQMSKATPRAAVAKFAAGGKQTAKKDLGLFAMSYGGVYVAQVALGADDSHSLRCFREAEAFDGPSLIIAYSHCIAHGYDLVHGLEQQKLAVQSAYWPLFRYDPDLAREGRNPFLLDSKGPTVPLRKYAYNETRYTMLAHAHPEAAEALLALAERDALERWRRYESLAKALPGSEVPHA
jgi:pyruvate-ferredoxin/flavodoxin oxidoreductase